MQSRDITGVWKGRYFLTDLVAHIKQTGKRIRGHAEVHPPFSSVDIYHFSGVVIKNHVQATHHKGNSYKGLIMNQSTIVGTITTPKGKELHISVKRVSMHPEIR